LPGIFGHAPPATRLLARPRLRSIEFAASRIIISRSGELQSGMRGGCAPSSIPRTAPARMLGFESPAVICCWKPIDLGRGGAAPDLTRRANAKLRQLIGCWRRLDTFRIRGGGDTDADIT
jgi:hypothetical protein